MPTVVQWRRGTTTQNNNFTGASGELSVDTTLNTLRVHDGSTAGGSALVSATAAQTLTNKTLSSPAFSGTATGTLTTSGDITIGGNLTVNGVTTTINATTLTIDDLNIVVASGAASAAAANGAGLTVDGATATILYTSATDTWNFNKNIVGTLSTASQTNITAIGTLGSLTVTNAVTAGSFSGPLTGAVTGNASTATILQTARAINGTSFNGSADITVTAAAGTLTGATLNSGVTASSLTSVGTLGSLTVTNAVSLASITKSGSNGVGDIGQTGNRFATIYGLATSAQYADLAEVYTADHNYIPGTVVIFGGEKEVTVSTTSHDTRIAGVVSTNPAYLMNDGIDGVAVALTGRVPCRVLGPVTKGDRLVSSGVSGVAERLDMSNYQPGCIIGKALEAITTDEITTIEVVVGRL